MIMIGLFALGALVSLLLNSLADHLPPDLRGQRHRPQWPTCHHCGRRHTLIYAFATPSLILRQGRCEHCNQVRRARGLIVEWATGFSLAFIWEWAGGDVYKFLTGSFIALAFMLITVIDIEHRLILQVVIWPTVIVITLLHSFAAEPGLEKTLIGGAVGYGLVLGMYWFAQGFGQAVAKLRGQPLEEVVFGGGDVNLAAAVGVATGWSGVLFALIIAVFAAGAFSLAYIIIQLIRRRYTPYAAIPYGPFLVLGAMVMYLYGREFAAWYMAQ
jgi:prepilin signal peptidase PulO-like enzyme (type II secretory pathway)